MPARIRAALARRLASGLLGRCCDMKVHRSAANILAIPVAAWVGLTRPYATANPEAILPCDLSCSLFLRPDVMVHTGYSGFTMEVRRMDVLGWPDVPRLIAEAGPNRSVSVAAMRLSDGRRWEVSGERSTVAASTIKIPVLIALMRAVDDGRVNLNNRVVARSEDRVGGTGVLHAMSPDTPLTIADYAYLMIAVSDNTASNVLIDIASVPLVRQVVQDIGLHQTRLERRFLGRMPTPDEGQNWTSADDLVQTLAAIWGDTAASPNACAEMRRLLGLQQDRQMIPRGMPTGAFFAGKSGSLPGLAHDCGVVTGPCDSVALAILTEGFADPHEAFRLGMQISAAICAEAGIAGC